jgi:hypothetical protein
MEMCKEAWAEAYQHTPTASAWNWPPTPPLQSICKSERCSPSSVSPHADRSVPYRYAAH